MPKWEVVSPGPDLGLEEAGRDTRGVDRRSDVVDWGDESTAGICPSGTASRRRGVEVLGSASYESHGRQRTYDREKDETVNRLVAVASSI